MLMRNDTAEAKWNGTVVVRLLRRWTAARAGGEAAPLPSLVALASELGVSANAAVALASLFQLSEECLGRPLEAECCCSPDLAADERAVLLLLSAEATMPSPLAPPDMPHGLPAVLLWAVASARRLLGRVARPWPAPVGACPFLGDRGGAEPRPDA